MEKAKVAKPVCLIILALSILLPGMLSAGEHNAYKITHRQMNAIKKKLDDPTPLYTETEWGKKIMPSEVWDMVTFDEQEMKDLWADVVGFRAPDVVGKIAPEIKPGKYTYKDKEKFPFKKLMDPYTYARFSPPGTHGQNHIGNFTEIEIIPTRQMYLNIPIAKATIRNMGKTKLDDGGYIIDESYDSGLPFPRPAGDHKGQQIMYNWVKRHNGLWPGNQYHLMQNVGVDRKFRVDYDYKHTALYLDLSGRACQAPYGFYDERAKKQGEQRLGLSTYLAPRDAFGNRLYYVIYNNRDAFNLSMLYLSSMRRIRRLSTTDTQDQIAGNDAIYDDAGGFVQKLTPSRYPYSYKVTGEGELLMPFTPDGSAYIDSKNSFEWKGLKFQRRPVVFLEMSQLDSSYIYSKRLWIFDREIPGMWYQMVTLDQKGRVYRTMDGVVTFLPPMGAYDYSQCLMADHIDTHSTFAHWWTFPAPWISRKDFAMKEITRAVK